MKTAREWADELLGCDVGTIDVDDIRNIQRDAILGTLDVLHDEAESPTITKTQFLLFLSKMYRTTELGVKQDVPTP